MKKLVVLAGVFALAACGGSDAEGDASGEAGTEAGSVLPATAAGTYVGANEAGEEVTSTLNADGTFEDRLGEEVIRTGTWEDNIRGTCFTEEGVDGDQCYNIGAVAEDGSVEVTGPDGVTTTMTKTQ